MTHIDGNKGIVNDSTIHSRLKSERIRLNLTQEKMAKLCGCTKRSQANYEAGERVPNAIYLKNASLIGIDVCYVLGTSSQSHKQDKSHEISVIYESLSPSARTYALAFMRGLAAQTEAGRNG